MVLLMRLSLIFIVLTGVNLAEIIVFMHVHSGADPLWVLVNVFYEVAITGYVLLLGVISLFKRFTPSYRQVYFHIAITLVFLCIQFLFGFFIQVHFSETSVWGFACPFLPSIIIYYISSNAAR